MTRSAPSAGDRRRVPLVPIIAFVVLVILGFAMVFTIRSNEGPPHIASIEPRAVEPGGTVVLSGSGFGESRERSRVLIGGIPLAEEAYIAWMDTRIEIGLPADTAGGGVAVAANDGESNVVLLTVPARLPIPEHSEDPRSPKIENPLPSPAYVGSLATVVGQRFGDRIGTVWVPTAGGPAEHLPVPTSLIADWSAGRVSFYVPTGAISGEARLEAADGAATTFPLQVIAGAGGVWYGAPATHLVSVGIDLVPQVRATKPAPEESVGLAAPLPLRQSVPAYVWLPTPVSIGAQRSSTIAYRTGGGLVPTPTGEVLLRVALPEVAPEESPRARLRVALQVVRRSVETRVDPTLVPLQSATPPPALAQYLRVDESGFLLTTGIVEALTTSAAATTNPYSRAARIFDGVVATLSPAAIWEVAPSEPARVSRRYADYFVAACRRVGVPARTIAGYLIVGTVAVPHIWAEFYLIGTGWVPVDPALEAGVPDVPLPLAEDAAGRSYFGRLDNQRFATYVEGLRPPAYSAGLDQYGRNLAPLSGHLVESPVPVAVHLVGPVALGTSYGSPGTSAQTAR